ncbi:uncharacterized protein LOC113564581 [Drosophila erecta]|uniref:uncharacterized protein LOC6549738 n=1 Tax=Drosophila erecta TaxID=7220 RepID=UPI000F05D83D|nr:uncharacterized protein LOC6549738 [Drosophila erecta]XP_026838423.1 uncharacterized protein LOC113564581 [Drosophila erecta]
MGKKFCYSEKNTHARIEKKQNRQGAQNSQLEKGQDAEEKEDDGELGVLKNLANGYLKLVHEIEAHLCLPAPPLIEAKPEREVGGEIARNFQSEEEMSQSSEDTTHPGIGFVDLYRRSLYFECLGIPLTSLELFSMECQKNEELEGRVMGGYRAGTEGLDERLTKETEWVAERNLSNRADYHPPKRRNTLENTSKSILFSGKPTKRKPVEHKPVETDLDDETEALLDDEHGSQYSRMELYQHSPKFQSRSSWEYTSKEPSVSSRRSHFKPHKIAIRNPIAEISSEESVRLPVHYPTKPYKWGKFPASSSSKTLGKPSRGKKKSPSPENRELHSCSEITRPRWDTDFGGLGEPKSFRSNKKTRNTTFNGSKLSLFSRWVTCRPEGKSNRCNQGNTFRLHGGFTPKPLEVFGVAHAPNAVESSSVEVSGKRLEERKKSCLKKSNRPVAESDFETMEPLRSNDTFTEAWKNSNFNRGQHHQDLRIGGLYSRAEKLKYQPIDRVDAGCSGVPLFKDSDESLERTRYFVSEFDKLSRAERMQDIELRIGQLRWLQAMSDKEYRQRFRKKRIAFKPVLANSMPHACPLNHDECPAVLNDTLLGHFVSRHLDEPGKELREIFEGEQVLMIFSPRAFQPGKTECMSVLGYGGVRNKPCTLPAVRFMPTRNTDLPEPYAHFDAHLPLLVMICRIRLSSVEGRKLRFGGPRLEDEDSLALWLVSRDLPCPIHVVMTVLNRRLDITRSSIMKVRELHKSHDPLDFMLSSKNYMRLSDHDLRVLTNDHTEPIYMEIVVKEYAGIFPRHIPDHFQGVA